MSEIVSLYKCSCGALIRNPTDGIVVHGNVYVADPVKGGGLIGNNFPDGNDCSKTVAEQTEETAYCVSCFIKAAFPDHKFSVTRGRAID